MATSNPVEYEGTYPLPEAQLDRFLVRLAVGYPRPRRRRPTCCCRRLARRREETAVAAVVDPRPCCAMQAGVEQVAVDPDVVRYCVALAAATRAHPAVEVGASPRGSLALLLVARALAVLAGRDFVTPEDVKDVAVAALAHRITLNPADLGQRAGRRRRRRDPARPACPARPRRRARGDRDGPTVS